MIASCFAASYAAAGWGPGGYPAPGPGYCWNPQGELVRCNELSLSSTARFLAPPVSAPTTPTGIAIDTDWKAQVYAFAQKYAQHPAWGIAHFERDYRMTLELAHAEGIAIDEDVLFACAFLHDIGGIPPNDKPGVDHALRTTQVVEPLLPTWGFPMEKWPAVKDMILGHIYYGVAPASLQSQAFRDADIVDFLGVIGAARIFAVAEEEKGTDTTLKPSVQLLRNFVKTMPGLCSLSACKPLAAERAQELTRLLDRLDVETYSGKVQ